MAFSHGDIVVVVRDMYGQAEENSAPCYELTSYGPMIFSANFGDVGIVVDPRKVVKKLPFWLEDGQRLTDFFTVVVLKGQIVASITECFDKV